MNHFIVQFGSGSPGEVNFGVTERKVLQWMGLENPVITYIPFHHIDHQRDNDWQKLLSIFQPFTNRPIQLLELYRQEFNHSCGLLNHSDLIILGSGLCEPWIQVLFESGLNKCLYRGFERGASIMGYSAGAIALCDSHICTLFFREFFHQYNNSLYHMPKEQFEHFKTSVLYEIDSVHRPQLETIFQSQKPVSPHKHPLGNEVFSVLRMPALGFLPQLSILPHFEEAPHATTQHLWHALKRFPRYIHIGIPNGTALIHRYHKQCLFESRILGENPDKNRKVTRILPDRLLKYDEFERVELQDYKS